MMSINGGSELLLYGGFEGTSTQSGIWKFTLADNAWTQIGNMIVPRDDHFILPANGLSC